MSDHNDVSINQSRVDYCGAGIPAQCYFFTTCPSIRAASTTAAISRLLRFASCCVSINQSRVDYCGFGAWCLAAMGHKCPSIRAASTTAAHADCTCDTCSTMCPSIRAASTTAAGRARRARDTLEPVSINQSRVDYCGATPPHHGIGRGWVSINQSRVDYCGLMSSTIGSPTPVVSINQSRVDYCGEGWRLMTKRVLVSINQSRVDYCGPRSPKLLKIQHLCVRFRARARGSAETKQKGR